MPYPRAYPELAAIVGGNVPDLRGYFLRGYGGNSAALGVAQGDAIRNITGQAYSLAQSVDSYGAAGGAMYMDGGGGGESSQGWGAWARRSIYFDASRVVPTASENRPVNRSVRYLIRALP